MEWGSWKISQSVRPSVRPLIDPLVDARDGRPHPVDPTARPSSAKYLNKLDRYAVSSRVLHEVKVMGRSVHSSLLQFSLF